ncbi:MAG: hypothetical protein K8T20_01975 [Planctomycetes bacterium]|nr:hypothetical protein [Planctomycetota bacterium]
MTRTAICSVLILVAGCTSSAPPPGVQVTQPGIDRRVVYTNDSLWINAITPLGGKAGPRVVVGSHHGAAILNRDYSQESLIQFSDLDLNETLPVDLDGKGSWAFFDGSPSEHARLISGEGKLLWKFPNEDAPAYTHKPKAMIAADLNKDGSPEFLVGCGGGLQALDQNGKILWEKEGANVFAVEVLDVGGTLQIIHQNGMQVVLCSLDGGEIRRLQSAPGRAGKPFSWPGEKYRGTFAMVDHNSVSILDLLGNERETIKLKPSRGQLEEVQPVHFAGSQCYAATCQVSYQHGEGYFYLFDSLGKVLHGEAFSQRVGGIAVLSDPRNPDLDVILIGVGKEVIELRER